MALECFHDKEIAGILNRDFIPVKLDRDERPDIDRRYQMAVSAMCGEGGWPLSVFLTPDREPFYGGTYFPPEDRAGRPGFRKVLMAVSALYAKSRDEISDYTEKLLSMLRGETVKEEISDKTVHGDIAARMLEDFDPDNGGFGTAPKFPMSGTIDFLIRRWVCSGDKEAREAVRRTLQSMAAGGIHDHVGGGFHRYSTDPAWIIPHFEKMADDNAWLLRNYLDAFSVLGDAVFRETAIGIMRFVRDVLSDPEGGFYSSQDADLHPGDEGGYFTWTDDDFRRLFDDVDYEIMRKYFFHDAGIMPRDKSKRVLFAVRGVKEISGETGYPQDQIRTTIRRGMERLLLERRKRKSPFVDKVLYASLNGMMAAAFLRGRRVLGDLDAGEFALLSLDRVLGMLHGKSGLQHTVGVPAFLDDYVFIADALVSAYEITGDDEWLGRAVEIMDECLERLWDGENGGFYDSREETLGIRIKSVEDIPQPSANAMAVIVLRKLHDMTGADKYRIMADRLIETFYGRASAAGLHAGYYNSALLFHSSHPVLTVNAAPGTEIAEAALSVVVPDVSIVYGKDEGCIIPCAGGSCHEPVRSPAGIRDFLASQGYNNLNVSKSSDEDCP